MLILKPRFDAERAEALGRRWRLAAFVAAPTPTANGEGEGVAEAAE